MQCQLTSNDMATMFLSLDAVLGSLGAVLLRLGVFTRSMRPLLKAGSAMHRPAAHSDALLLGTGENVAEVVVEKEKSVLLYLVCKVLSSWVAGHLEPNAVAPFQKPGFRHGGNAERGRGPNQADGKQTILMT